MSNAHKAEAVTRRVPGADHLNRAVRACRRAGLTVINQHECTCRLRGRLVLLAQPGRLELLWPYRHPCPIHDLAARHPRRVDAGRQEARKRDRHIDLNHFANYAAPSAAETDTTGAATLV
jgi:hypothetical protein